jgi:hypothetical protein
VIGRAATLHPDGSSDDCLGELPALHRAVAGWQIVKNDVARGDGSNLARGICPGEPPGMNGHSGHAADSQCGVAACQLNLVLGGFGPDYMNPADAAGAARLEDLRVSLVTIWVRRPGPD